ncbi:hypothetical protein Mlab_0329 [Methanocorpusculum labreanum Z]|uniref:Uncharacterized protein n=1 Tax=Methanocorpusculum labreanum (strain ATCC 43576 / DSM 4855 / Z) TaxID=410358 RepID=A2SQ99_METLZ|nr:hypothetical protein [Methanocorpusculum labreanum]ABN06505.1 hypothetical protein Mlab_0329 [Methanocorpusculum labreanum Z]
MAENPATVSDRPVIGLEKELQEIDEAIERFGDGAPAHIAIVSEPLGGRTTIANEIRRLYGERVNYLPLKFVISPASLPDFSACPEDIILIDNCRLLATRRIGGFDVLDAFLRALISSKKLFITTWNIYSWQYLSAVMNIEAYFSTVIVLAKMDAPDLKKVIMSRYKPGEIRFISDGVAERSMFFSLVHKQIRLPLKGTEVSIPWIKLNFTLMLRRLPRKKRIQISLEDLIFEKINRISRGTPGVAVLLWESSLNDNVISLNSITETPYSINLDTSDSFILTIILSMKSLQEEDLTAIVGSEMDIRRVLYRLVCEGLVRNDDGYYSIPAFALEPVAEYLKKTRRLW